MAVLTVQRPATAAGVAQTMATAAAGGDTFANSGKEFLRVTNAHATLARTVTVDSPGVCSFSVSANAAHDSITSIAALTTKIIGPFPVAQFSETGAITYSDAAADLTIAVLSKD